MGGVQVPLAKNTTTSSPNQQRLASTNYQYDQNTLALDTEEITIDPDGSGPLPSITRVLDRTRDELGRDIGFSLQGSAGVPPT